MTILTALSEIASQQASPTEKTMERVNTFLDYMATNPNAVIRYYASDMILNVCSGASYLTAPKSRSRAGGHFFPWLVTKGRMPHLPQRRHSHSMRNIKMHRHIRR